MKITSIPPRFKHKTLIIKISLLVLALTCISNKQTFAQKQLKLANQYYSKALNIKREHVFDSAGHWFVKASSIYKKKKKWRKYVACQIEIVSNLCDGKFLDSAMHVAHRLLAVTQKKIGENSVEESRARFRIGYIYYLQEQHNKAIIYFKKSLKIKIKHKIKGEELTRLYYRIGVCYRKLDRLDEAFKNFNTILSIQPSAGAYMAIGNTYLRQRSYKKGLEHYQKALQCYRNESKHLLGILYGNLGLGYKKLELYSKALKHYHLAIKTFKDIPNYSLDRFASVYNNIGSLYGFIGKYNKGIAFYKKALYAYKRCKECPTTEIGFTYRNFGFTYASAGKYKESTTYYQQALKIYNRYYSNGKHSELAFTYLGLGRTYYLNKQYTQSIQAYQRALVANFKNFNDQKISQNPNLKTNTPYNAEHCLEALLGKAVVLKKMKYYQEALSVLLTCDTLINQVFVMHTNPQDKISLSKKVDVVYDIGVQVSNVMNKPHLAFYFSEKSKANVLSRSLNENKAKYSYIPDSLIQKELKLKKQITVHRKLLLEAKNDKNRANSRNVIFDLNQSLDQLKEQFEHQFPKYYEAQYSRSIVSIKMLQKKLHPKQAIIQYSLLWQHQLVIFVITRQSIYTNKVVLPTSISKLTHDYLSSIKKSKHPRFIQKAHLLYQLFIEPVKKHLKEKDKLIIIPEANLLSIPFGALLTEKKAITTPYSQLPYLIKRYEIQYNYSASLWHASHSTPPVKLKRKLLAFAPVFDNKEGYVIDANILKANKTHNPNNERGAIDMLTKTWKTLAHSKTEVDSITHLFLKNGHKYSKALIRTKASEANFKKYCANYQFLHLATHSQVNKKTPALSYVAFTPDSTINKNEDGNLYLEEIHNLRLNTKLVVLSSCDSGVGKLEAGEGVISLSRAFLHAGAQNILFSLWSVNDKATKNQMLHFYANILNNASYSKALHTAKLKMIKTLKVAKPYFWAGFIFIGK